MSKKKKVSKNKVELAIAIAAMASFGSKSTDVDTAIEKSGDQDTKPKN